MHISKKRKLEKVAKQPLSINYWERKMSYRDLRNFIEMMQGLGYPRLISMENFRTPNFPLVAEILIWLVKRFDSDTDIPLEIQSENERIALIRSVAQLLVLKANLKLNTKKLYQADGYAVKEMLKITTLLHDSLKTTDLKNRETDDVSEVSVVATALKLQELKSVTNLVGSIISSGASLYDLLSKEAETGEIRNYKASRQLEMPQIEQAVKESIDAISQEISNTKQSIENMLAKEASLDVKIEKKKSDLERHNKRLQTLKKIRPAFMEEFEKLEEELKGLYDDYVIKYRNATYLESVLEQMQQAAHKKFDRQQIIIRKQIEELNQDDESVHSADIYFDKPDENFGKIVPETRDNLIPRRAVDVTDVNERKTRQRRAFGSMTGGGTNESESLDSDSDLLLDGEITEDDDDDLEIDKQHVRDFSDDDF